MVGERLSHYEILSELGAGGMGVVYKARDLRLNRLVAIKLLRPDKSRDESRRRRFVQEARAASALNHPNIITVHEIDEIDGRDFIVMEFVPGKALEKIIPHGGLPVRDVLKYATPVASALAAAHSNGIVHRDLKPANIMIGPSEVVKVLDFGVAKLTQTESSDSAETLSVDAGTAAGSIVGTAAYMSPEQAQGKSTDARSDIFSFGVVLYEMVTGQRPFKGSSPISTIAAIIEQEPTSPGSIEPRIPRGLERLILRCLRKDPERRFQAMADVKIALEELEGRRGIKDCGICEARSSKLAGQATSLFDLGCCFDRGRHLIFCRWGGGLESSGESREPKPARRAARHTFRHRTGHRNHACLLARRQPDRLRSWRRRRLYEFLAAISRQDEYLLETRGSR